MYDCEEDDAADDGRPHMTEAEAEKLHERQERLLERVQARFRREEKQRFKEILSEELERMSREEAEKGAIVHWELRTEEDGDAAEIEEDDETDDDPVDDTAKLKVLSNDHPLAVKTRDAGIKIMQFLRDKSGVPRGTSPEHPLVQLAYSAFHAGVKLTGALAIFPPPRSVAALCIVNVKRASGHLEDARAAIDDAIEQELTDAVWLSETRVVLTELLEETERIISELRALLNGNPPP